MSVTLGEPTGAALTSLRSGGAAAVWPGARLASPKVCRRVEAWDNSGPDLVTWHGPLPVALFKVTGGDALLATLDRAGVARSSVG